MGLLVVVGTFHKSTPISLKPFTRGGLRFLQTPLPPHLRIHKSPKDVATAHSQTQKTPLHRYSGVFGF